jgi:hypothetical protein
MVGKTVEIFAFELKEVEYSITDSEKQARLTKIQELTRDSLVDLSKFKIDGNNEIQRTNAEY